MGVLGYGWQTPCDVDDALKARIIGGLLAYHLVSHWLIHRVLCRHRHRIVLTARTLRDGVCLESFLRDAAYNLQGVLLHSVQGPLSAHAAWRAVASSPAVPVWPAQDLAHAPGCEAGVHANVMGAVFTSWALFQVLWMVAGCERGVDMYIHHTLFLLATIVGPYYNICPELILFTLAMECSTAPLNAMLVTRSLQGWEGVAEAIAPLFAVSFLLFRVVLFGWGLWRSLAFWWAPPSAAGSVGDLRGRLGAVAGLHALLAGAFVLQLFWARVLVAKAVSKLRGKED